MGSEKKDEVLVINVSEVWLVSLVYWITVVVVHRAEANQNRKTFPAKNARLIPATNLRVNSNNPNKHRVRQ